eukprot:Platyproteum_vivax@DN300_c0_g1_i1.p1
MSSETHSATKYSVNQKKASDVKLHVIELEQDIADFAISKAKECIRKARNSELRQEHTMARIVKEALDSKYDAVWHVIVGKHFGSFVTHETDHLIHFSIGPVAFLVFGHER